MSILFIFESPYTYLISPENARASILRAFDKSIFTSEAALKNACDPITLPSPRVTSVSFAAPKNALSPIVTLFPIVRDVRGERYS